MITAATTWFGTEETNDLPSAAMAPAELPLAPGLARALPRARPALIGPGPALAEALETGEALDAPRLADLLAPWTAHLAALAETGAAQVQIHEPLLGTGLSKPLADALKPAYAALAAAGPAILLSGAEGAPGPDLWTALSLPVAGLHLDLVTEPGQLRDALDSGVDMIFSLGLIDGQAEDRADLAAAARWARVAMRRHGAARIEVTNARPLRAATEDPERPWIACRAKKEEEIALAALIAAEGEAAWQAALAENACARALRDHAALPRLAGAAAARV
ncbi:hypothetical protein ACQ5SO_11770 [Rhodovulum sp. DZ06]|uniref:hypothetical protein n=1 Tax=Rhodovulum sp. DZ06 TaxID=3425126 RepID=UPI003D32FCD3